MTGIEAKTKWQTCPVCPKSARQGLSWRQTSTFCRIAQTLPDVRRSTAPTAHEVRYEIALTKKTLSIEGNCFRPSSFAVTCKRPSLQHGHRPTFILAKRAIGANPLAGSIA